MVNNACLHSSHLARRLAPRTLALAWALALLATSAARADGLDVDLRYGQDGGHYDGAGVGIRFPSRWTKDLGHWKATLRPELEFNHFRYTGSGPGPESLNQVGGIALFRFEYGERPFRPYAEIGLGATLFSRDDLGTKHFSSHFQFSEQIGVGVELAGSWFVGWRYSHYSNAGIEEPNDGLDMHQLVLGTNF